MTSQMKAHTPSRYDLVLAVEDLETATPDRIIAKDRLVWIGNRQISSYRTAPVRLAAHPGACLYRLHGHSALATLGRPFTVAFESTSRAAIERFVLEAGGVSIAPATTLTARLRALGPDEGFPTLPHVALSVYSGPAPRPRVKRLEATIRKLLSAPPSAA
jgi:DNA-binding transcriptional LysR family regulator